MTDLSVATQLVSAGGVTALAIVSLAIWWRHSRRMERFIERTIMVLTEISVRLEIPLPPAPPDATARAIRSRLTTPPSGIRRFRTRDTKPEEEGP